MGEETKCVECGASLEAGACVSAQCSRVGIVGVADAGPTPAMVEVNVPECFLDALRTGLDDHAREVLIAVRDNTYAAVASGPRLSKILEQLARMDLIASCVADLSRRSGWRITSAGLHVLSPPPAPLCCPKLVEELRAKVDRHTAQIGSLQTAVAVLERKVSPMQYGPSLAEKLREGWASGRKLVGLTASANEPVWGNPDPKSGAGELRKAAADFDDAALKLGGLIDQLEPASSECAIVRDVHVSLLDAMHACNVAARTVG